MAMEKPHNSLCQAPELTLNCSSRSDPQGFSCLWSALRLRRHCSYYRSSHTLLHIACSHYYFELPPLDESGTEYFRSYIGLMPHISGCREPIRVFLLGRLHSDYTRTRLFLHWPSLWASQIWVRLFQTYSKVTMSVILHEGIYWNAKWNNSRRDLVNQSLSAISGVFRSAECLPIRVIYDETYMQRDCRET